MPPLTRWFIKTGLVYLVLALATGVLVAAGTAVRLPYPFASLSDLYIQTLMVGWLTQLIFGVAYWMFPVYTREAPRRSPTLGWTAYGLLNAGLVLRIVVAISELAGPAPKWLAAVASLCLFFAALAFVVNAWHRVKGH